MVYELAGVSGGATQDACARTELSWAAHGTGALEGSRKRGCRTRYLLGLEGVDHRTLATVVQAKDDYFHLSGGDRGSGRHEG